MLKGEEKINFGGLGGENRHLPPFEWFKHSISEGGRLGQLISHAQFQGLESKSSIRTRVILRRRKQLLQCNSLWRIRKSSIQMGSGRDRRRAENASTKKRGRPTGLRLSMIPTVCLFLSYSHKLEYIENGV